MTAPRRPRQWLDQGDWTILAVCECGWRELVGGYIRGREAITRHVEGAHPEQLHLAQRAERKAKGK